MDATSAAFSVEWLELRKEIFYPRRVIRHVLILPDLVVP